MRVAAKVISIVFHPLFLPTYIFGLLMFTVPQVNNHPSYVIPADSPIANTILGNYQSLTLIKVFMLTFFFPMITLLLMKALGFVESIYLRGQKERILPYIAVSVYLFWAFMVFRKGGDHDLFSIALLGPCIAIMVSFLINATVMKISMHTVGAGLIIGLMRGLIEYSQYELIYLFLGIILLAGIIGSARLLLKAHTQHEIFIGYLVGIVSQLVAFNIYTYF